MARASKTSKQFPLRLPDGLSDRVREVADQNNRSMNSEIVTILKRAVFDPLENEKADAPRA